PALLIGGPTSPLRPPRPTGNQHSSCCQQQMGGTIERGKRRFNAKELVPEEISDAAEQKDPDTNKREAIANGLAQASSCPAKTSEQNRADQHNCGSQEPTVDHGMPGSEEGVRQFIGVCPAVQIKSDDKPGREEGDAPFKPGACRSPQISLIRRSAWCNHVHLCSSFLWSRVQCLCLRVVANDTYELVNVLVAFVFLPIPPG